MNSLKAADTHFAFGENWAEYAKHIDSTHIKEAEKGLLCLLKEEEIKDKTFIDIGSGSGLHSLAALNLGATFVLATDIDKQSVSTTMEVLDKHAPRGSRYQVSEISVFDLPQDSKQQYDIVYSWGVLHHTGAMYEAIKCASKLVKNEGLFVFSIYRKTKVCFIWKYIKFIYSHSPKILQKFILALFVSVFKWRFKANGKDFNQMKENYVSSRGMSFEHDVHDWLGGYPYESASANDIIQNTEEMGFKLIKSNVTKPGSGYFGTGCDEFVFKMI